MLIAETEYDTARTLPEFAARFLDAQFRVVVVNGAPPPATPSFSALDEIADADVLLVSVRRYTLPPAQLERIRRFVASGRPVVGIRTASHAFLLREGSPPAGQSAWPEWDEQVIGCHYDHHHSIGKTVTISAVRPEDPILAGMRLPFTSGDSLYRVLPLCPGASALLAGAVSDEPPQPVAWTFIRRDGGRTFYTSLGSPGDFDNPEFNRLLLHGVRWAAGLSVEETKASPVVTSSQSAENH